MTYLLSMRQNSDMSNAVYIKNNKTFKYKS